MNNLGIVIFFASVIFSFAIPNLTYGMRAVLALITFLIICLIMYITYFISGSILKSIDNTFTNKYVVGRLSAIILTDLFLFLYINEQYNNSILKFFLWINSIFCVLGVIQFFFDIILRKIKISKVEFGLNRFKFAFGMMILLQFTLSTVVEVTKVQWPESYEVQERNITMESDGLITEKSKENQTINLEDKFISIYYTVVSFSGVGDSEIVPKSILSKINVMIIAMSNIIFFTIFISSFLADKGIRKFHVKIKKRNRIKTHNK